MTRKVKKKKAVTLRWTREKATAWGGGWGSGKKQPGESKTTYKGESGEPGMFFSPSLPGNVHLSLVSCFLFRTPQCFLFTLQCSHIASGLLDWAGNLHVCFPRDDKDNLRTGPLIQAFLDSSEQMHENVSGHVR